MQTQLAFIQPQTKFTSLIPFLIPAAIVTFGLFAGMHALIANKQIPRVDPTPSPIINLMHKFEDTPTITKKTLPPIPEPKPQPKNLPKIEEPKPNTAWTPGLLSQTIGVPRINNTMGTEYMLPGGDARPIVRIEPKYPIDAAREGIEGWVRLSFSVSPSGAVENIKIVDAQPKRIFNRAAKQALAKWKYKPNVVKGKTHTQDGLVVMLDFKLAS